jgi:maltose alpha-D-glucosyltransferase/alpha-amylase
MRFWLDMGCDGFRIDMAESLVKNDPQREGTQIVWRDILGTIRKEYPESAMVAEWGISTEALDCGFDMDFVLDWNSNVSKVMMRNYKQNMKTGEITDNYSYFSKDSGADVSAFLEEFLPQYEAAREKGLWCFITSNHDHVRPSAGLTEEERKLAFSWIFTLPGVPFLYYGDEIGMEYRVLPTKEGGYHRTGSRTPMQWSDACNQGFSDAPAEKLYLPVEDNAAHTVAAQEGVKGSLLETVRELIKLRHQEKELQNYSPFSVYRAEEGSRLFAYKRGENILVATNPGTGTEVCELDGNYEILYTVGQPVVEEKTLKMPAQSFVVLKK